MDREQRTIKAIAEAIARGECPPRTTPREWTHFEKQAKAVFYDLVLTVQLHDDDDESPAKASGDVLTFDQAEQALCAAYGRGWRATAATFTSPTKVGGDEREALSDDEVALLASIKQFHTHDFGRGPELHADAIADAYKKGRAALSADGKTEPEHTAIYLSKRLVGHDGEASFIQAHINQAVSEAVEALSADGGEAARDEFIRDVSKQHPEKPDYWSSCGQCQNNIERAQDLIDAAIAANQLGKGGE